MNDLIKLSEHDIGSAAVQTVNARDLHSFLEVGKDFSTWIKDRIAQYGFAESTDYEAYEAGPQNGGAGNRGIRTEYALTLDMAKELAMVERTAKGKQARQYFIECERRLKALDPSKVLSDPAAMRGLLLSYTEKVIELEGQVSDLTPKAQALDRLATADGSLCVTDAAKALQVRPKDLFDYLRSHGWIYRRTGTAHDLGYQSKVAIGLLEHKVTIVQKGDGTERLTEQVRITPKGLAALAKLFPQSLLVAAA